MRQDRDVALAHEPASRSPTRRSTCSRCDGPGSSPPAAKVSHQPSDDRSHVHVEVVIKDAFAAARRQIEALAQRASGKVKLHEVEAHGRVSKISAEEDYGFIATPDGREIYFHRNSVIDNAFDRLSVGSEVRFAEELGEKGAQASTW
jgi:cold shock CspA family protein